MILVVRQKKPWATQKILAHGINPDQLGSLEGRPEPYGDHVVVEIIVDHR